MKEILQSLGIEDVNDEVLAELLRRSKGTNLSALPGTELFARYHEAREELEKKKKKEAEKDAGKPSPSAPLPPGPPVRPL